MMLSPGNRKLAFCLLAALVLSAGGVAAQEPDDEAPAAETKDAKGKAKGKEDRKSVGEAQKAGKRDPNVALKAFELGTKAYEVGKLDPAIQALSTALANGGLPPDKMAKAYYYRGLAYKKQKKPAQALSDFTISVWVNGGLNDTDRAAALENRNAVYREAGLGDQAPPITTSSAPAPLAPATPAPAAAAAAPALAPPPTPAVTPPPPPPPVVAASPPPPAPAIVAAPAPPPPAASAEKPVWQAETDSKPPPQAVADSGPVTAIESVSPAPAQRPRIAGNDAYTPPPPAAAAVPETAPASGLASTPEPPQPSSDTLSPVAKAGESIGNFFSNMFGESSPPPKERPPTVTTGSNPADGTGWVDAPAGAPPAGPSVQVSASDPQRAPGYDVAAATPPPSPIPSAPKVQAIKPPKTSSGGKYRLQLASVRSREEADRLVQTLMASHANQLGDAEPIVDETVIGNMGTFFRVRVGPYANASEPGKLCTTLKPQGFDCQVVTK